MKKNITALIIAFLLGVSHATGENVLLVNNINVPQGGNSTLEIGCDFDKEYTAFELELSLSEGLSLVVEAGNGKPIVEKCFSTEHVLSGSKLSNGNYKFTCYSMENTSLPSGGTLMRLTIKADESVSPGATLPCCIMAAEFTRTSDSEGENLQDVNFNVTIEDICTVLDESSTEMPIAESGVKVRIKRTIGADVWSPICLPFSMTEEQTKEAFGNDVKLADFVGIEPTVDAEENVIGLTVNFSDVVAIEANHPYIIKVSESISEFTVDSVNIDPKEVPSVDMDHKRVKVGSKWFDFYNSFIGTYVADTELLENMLFLSGNRFWYSTGKTKIKAYHAYFDFYDVLTEMEEAETRISFNFVEDLTKMTEINKELMGTDKVYDLQGRKVNSQLSPIPSSFGGVGGGSHLKKGIYIKNGKKILVK